MRGCCCLCHGSVVGFSYVPPACARGEASYDRVRRLCGCATGIVRYGDEAGGHRLTIVIHYAHSAHSVSPPGTVVGRQRRTCSSWRNHRAPNCATGRRGRACVDMSTAVDDGGRVRRCASCDRRRYDNAIARDACNRTLSASIVAASISAASISAASASLRRDADAFSRSGRSPAFPRARPRSVRASDRRSADASRCCRGPRAHTAPPSP